MAGEIKVVDKIKEFGEKAVDVFDMALNNLADDIVRLAKSKVPYKEGDLYDEIMKEKLEDLAYRVMVDSEYASYQEKGKRADGSHVVREYTTANTGAHFLETSGDKVAEKALQYLKEANQLIRMKV